MLESVTLSVEQGETLGLVGESGSGKTTLARCILGLTPADGGRITFGARDLPLRIERRNASMLRELQMVFQNPDMSLNPRHTVRTILVRPLRLLGGLRRNEADTAARDLLHAVNLDPGFLDRYPSQLSGGEKQRVAIARAFAARSRLVICDEPVSGLDVSVQATVLNLLQDLQRRWGTAYLFISHDLQVVQYLADRVVVLYRGHIVETGTTVQVFSGPNHPYTELLLSAIPRVEPDGPGTALRWRAKPGPSRTRLAVVHSRGVAIARSDPFANGSSRLSGDRFRPRLAVPPGDRPAARSCQLGRGAWDWDGLVRERADAAVAARQRQASISLNVLT